ncbi:hypothetical protein FRC02_011959 [Tulasnella sp. 418]|nr:hypothetical protein FRC02_011959 [Tulasnella sp. 418]
MPGLCFEMWLCALVVRRAYEQSRSDRFIGRHRNILSLLILDSVIWFGVIFILMLWISLGLSFAPRGYNIIGLSYYHTGVNVGGSRLILHMRRAYFNSQMKPVDRSAGVLGFALPFQPPTHSNSPQSANRTPSYIQDAFSVGSDEYENMEEVEMGETLSRFVPARDMRIDVNVQVEVEVRVTNAETLSHLGLP